MHIDYLIHMANDIAAFFASEQDEATATEGILQHLQRYWDPRMKAQIIAHYSETGGADLHGPVRLAVQQLSQSSRIHASPE